MLNTRELQPGQVCLYRRLTLAYERRAVTPNGHDYHVFTTQGGTEKRLGEAETARQVWMDITDCITGAK